MFEIELVRYFQIAALGFYVLVHILWATLLCIEFLKHIKWIPCIFAALLSIIFVGLGVYPVFYFLLNFPLSNPISGVYRLYEGICFTFVLLSFILGCSRFRNILKSLRSKNTSN